MRPPDMMLIMIALLGFIAGLLLVFAWHMNHRAGDLRALPVRMYGLSCALSLNFRLKNAPLWALGFICPRVHVSALSDRLGSELGVGYLHHRQTARRQASVAERPVALPPVQGKEPQMPPYFSPVRQHASKRPPASRPMCKAFEPLGRQRSTSNAHTAARCTKSQCARIQWRAETTDFAGSSRGPR